MQQIARESTVALGLDAAALRVQARLYKLVAYQPNGHFKTQRKSQVAVMMPFTRAAIS
jgi:hypothetical protein